MNYLIMYSLINSVVFIIKTAVFYYVLYYRYYEAHKRDVACYLLFSGNVCDPVGMRRTAGLESEYMRKCPK